MFNIYTTKYKPSETSVFFDVGCNAGSFVKMLKNKNIYNNIHCFEPHPVLSKTVKEMYPHVIMNNHCLYNKDGNIDINKIASMSSEDLCPAKSQTIKNTLNLGTLTP
jgi:FkbM family methyltransferase